MKHFIIYSILIGIIILLSIPVISEISVNNEYSISEEELKYFAEEINQSAGGFISAEVAYHQLARFKKRKFKPFYDINKRAYGHFFGLDSLRVLLKRIDNYNKQTSNEEKQIIGIRVYRSFKNKPKDAEIELIKSKYAKNSELTKKNSQVASTSMKMADKSKHDDVFLVPVLRDKSNYPDIDPDLNIEGLSEKEIILMIDSLYSNEEEPIILNTSVPCPNKCN